MCSNNNTIYIVKVQRGGRKWEKIPGKGNVFVVCSVNSSHHDAIVYTSEYMNICFFLFVKRISEHKWTRKRLKRMINTNNNNKVVNTEQNIPWAGEKTFKYKQSSDWFCKNGNNRFRYSNRPFGIFSNAPVSFWMFGKRCGHTGLNLSAIRIPFHGDSARVGLNLEKKHEKRRKIKFRGRTFNIYLFFQPQKRKIAIFTF